MQNQATVLNIVIIIICGYLIYNTIVTDIEEPDPNLFHVNEEFNHIHQQKYDWIETEE